MSAAILFGLLLCPWYYQVMEADAAITAYGCDYLEICLIGSGALVCSAALESLLQATGHSLGSMVVQGSCFLCNMVLDPLLIFGWCGFPALGVRGAAIATVAAQFLGLAMALALNLRYNRDLFPRLAQLVPQGRVLGTILRVGFPTMLLNLLVPVMTLGMNAILMPYSSEYVALFGIYFRVQLFFFLPLFGVNNGVIPMISYNMGAGQRERVRTTIRYGLTLALAISALGVLCFQTLGGQLLTVFHATEQMLPLGVRAFRIISVTFPLAAVAICLSGVFQGLGNGTFGLVVNLLRQPFVVAVAIVALAGIERIWYAYWVSESAAMVFCLVYAGKHLPAMLRETEPRLER